MPGEIQALAKQLAAERGIDSVSELLRKLIEEERDNPRLRLSEPTSAYADFIRQQKALNSQMAEYARKKKKA